MRAKNEWRDDVLKLTLYCKAKCRNERDFCPFCLVQRLTAAARLSGATTGPDLGRRGSPQEIRRPKLYWDS